MLEKVMTDNEYEKYVDELHSKNKYLFKVMYNQPLIKLEEDRSFSSDILCALSFVQSCYSLCKKGIKKKMIYEEENYNSKIRGKIDIKKNIRKNTSHGRNDKFYCKFISFSMDNIENQILKATLMKCKKIISQKFELSSEILQYINFCMNIFKNVKVIHINSSDFNRTNISGLYTYYRPILKQAKCILNQKYNSYKTKEGRVITKSTYTIPYMINMETVFEFYARVMIKECLIATNFQVNSYSDYIFLERGIINKSNCEKNIHIIPYCIPDLIITDVSSNKVAAVLDVKYKSHSRSGRLDTHQLLSYILLTGAEKCGFIFPGDITELKKFSSNIDYMILQTPLIKNLKYYELILSNGKLTDQIENMLH